MRTLGIDLSADDRKTCACLVEWGNGRATVATPELGLSNEDLVERILAADKAAIDAPFGWPDEFVEAIADYAKSGRFPTTERARLRYRETDRFVTQTRLPLSVSSDRIAVTAMRCASLLTQLGREDEPVDRAGSGRVVEVYPAAALVAWGFHVAGYKTKSATDMRNALLDSIVAVCGEWLDLPDDAKQACVRSDDAVDALVSSLVARAAACSLTSGAPAEHSGRARREGWIHLPTPDALARLAGVR